MVSLHPTIRNVVITSCVSRQQLGLSEYRAKTNIQILFGAQSLVFAFYEYVNPFILSPYNQVLKATKEIGPSQATYIYFTVSAVFAQFHANQQNGNALTPSSNLDRITRYPQTLLPQHPGSDLQDRGNWISFSAGPEDTALLSSVQTGSGAHKTPYVMHTMGTLTVVNWLRCKLTTHHHLQPRLNMPVALGLAPMHLKSSWRTEKTVPLSLQSFVQLAQTNYGRTAYLERGKLCFTLHVDTIKKLHKNCARKRCLFVSRNRNFR